jgi:hypothetical protein
MTEYFYEDMPPCDVVVEPGYTAAWRNEKTGETEGHPVIGAMANSEKGVAFLTAFIRAKDEATGKFKWTDDVQIETVTFPPEELDSIKRQAALADVSLIWQGKERKRGSQSH